MRFVEYGAENEKVILLLHGGGLAPWNYAGAADLLRKRYHIVVPVLDGHSGSDRAFTTIEDNAGELVEYIDRRFGGHVLLIGGLSLGGQILVEMLAQRHHICEYAVIESALVLPMGVTKRLVKPAVFLSHPLVKRRWFAKLQFGSLHMDSSLFEAYFQDSAAITRENMTRFLAANAGYEIKRGLGRCGAKALVLVGERERAIMKKSARVIHQSIPGSSLEMMKGCRHGELSLNHPERYVETLYRLIGVPSNFN